MGNFQEPISATALSERHQLLSSEVFKRLENHKYDQAGLGMHALSFYKEDGRFGKSFVNSVVYHYLDYDRRGLKLYRTLRREYDVKAFGYLWMIAVVLQIIYYIKKIWFDAEEKTRICGPSGKVTND